RKFFPCSSLLLFAPVDRPLFACGSPSHLCAIGPLANMGGLEFSMGRLFEIAECKHDGRWSTTDQSQMTVSFRRFLQCVVTTPLLWVLPVQAFLFVWRLDLLEPWGDELFAVDTGPQSIEQIGTNGDDDSLPP